MHDTSPCCSAALGEVVNALTLEELGPQNQNGESCSTVACIFSPFTRIRHPFLKGTDLHLGLQPKSLQENSLQVSVRVSTADKVCILSQLSLTSKNDFAVFHMLKLELAHN